MSREENAQEDVHDLSELEAALAALVPRAERLNRDRLMFLAGQASVESKNGQPGSPASATARPRRRAGWAWPAAFATMTGVAASLLVALAIRPAPQVTERIVERIVTAPAAPQEPAAAVAQGRVEPESAVDSPAMLAALPDWLAWEPFPQPAVSTKHEPSYPELRKQVLLHGLESWKPQASESAASRPCRRGARLVSRTVESLAGTRGRGKRRCDGFPRQLYETLQEPDHESSSRNPCGAGHCPDAAGRLRPDHARCRAARESGEAGLGEERADRAPSGALAAAGPQIPTPASVPRAPAGQRGGLVEPAPRRTDGLFLGVRQARGLWEKIEKWMEIPLGDPREKEYRAKAQWTSRSRALLRHGARGAVRVVRLGIADPRGRRHRDASSPSCSRHARMGGCCRPKRGWRSPKGNTTRRCGRCKPASPWRGTWPKGQP